MQGSNTCKIIFALFWGMICSGNPCLFAQESGAQPEMKENQFSRWKVDSNNSVKNNSNTNGIEIVHAEEGTYLGAQKSKEGILIFQGGIIVKINTKIIHADTLKINPETGEIYGEGGVILKDEMQTIKGSSFIYDSRIGAGVLYGIDGYYKPIYLIGDYSKITSHENLIITSAFLTTCKEESPHYFLKAKKIWLQKGNRFAAIDIIYHVGKIPVFYLPFLVQTDFGTGIETVFGFNDKQGIFLQNSYFYGFSGNPILPEKGIIMLDYYQYRGAYLGTLLSKKSPKLNYDIALGIALEREIAFLENGSVTNDILQEDGSVEQITNTLYEINANLNGKWNSSFEKDSQSAINVKFQQYNDASFNQLFKVRSIPETSLQSFSTGTNSRSQPLLNNLLWKMVYSENWLDNNLTVNIERHQIWQPYSDVNNDYSYYPTLDILPSIKFTKRWYLIKPTEGIFQGITQDILINTGLMNNYVSGEYSDTKAYGDMKAGLTAYFPFLSWISFQPSAGYGMTGQLSNLQSESVKLEDRRKTYHYFYNLDGLYIGPSFLKAGITYSLKLGIDPPSPDPYFDNIFENKMFFNMVSDFAPYGTLMIGTSRDLREYSWTSQEEDYWDPFYVSGFFDYDFINKNNIFVPNSMLPESHFLGIGISESLLYYTQFLNPGANSLALYFQTGGYQFWFFDKVRLIKTGAYWLHDFNNAHKNQIFLYLETKFSLFKNWGLDLKISTIGLNLGDSSEPYGALHDYFNNSLSGSDSPFYINEFSASIEHDLHDWIIRLTYAIRQNWIPFGTDNLNFAGYYEHSVYILFNLKGLKGSGIPKTQLYNFNPKDPMNADQYGLN